MKTYQEMNEQIISILRQSDNPAVLYAAARIEELERQSADATLTVHVHEKSLDEYAQTAYRLRKELEAERKLRREAEEALHYLFNQLRAIGSGEKTLAEVRKGLKAEEELR